MGKKPLQSNVGSAARPQQPYTPPQTFQPPGGTQIAPTGTGASTGNDRFEGQLEAPRMPATPTFQGGQSPLGGVAGVQGGLSSGMFSGGPSGPVGVGQQVNAPPVGDAAGGSNLDPELDALYQDIFKEHQDSWGGTEQMIQAQTQMNQRRAAEVNSMMGRSIGGGFGGMFAQAMLNGQQQMMGSRQTWADRGRQLQLGYLDRQLTEKHRTEDLESQAAQAGVGNPATGSPPAQDSQDDLLGRTDSSGQNAWTGLNEGYNQYGWDRAQLDEARAFAVKFKEANGYWPSGKTLNSYLQNKGTTGTTVGIKESPIK